SRGGSSFDSGSFRVEEFRLPVLEGRIAPVERGPLVQVRKLPTAVQVNYVSGGPAGALPVRVSAMVRGKSLQFDDFDAFSFDAPDERAVSAAGDEDEEEAAPASDARVVADKLAVTLDKNG